MDNFRKTPKRAKKTASLDGFVSRNGVGDTARPAVGDFAQTEGFNPRNRGQIGFESSRHQERQQKRDHMGVIAVGDQLPHASKKKRDWRKKAKRVAISAFAISLMTTGYVFINGYLKARHILAGGGSAAALDENVDPTRLNGEGDGRVNILLLGRGGEGHTAPNLTDTILIASVDPVHKEAALLSIPRDFYAKGSNNNKINSLYSDAKSKVLNGKKVDNQQEKAEAAGLEAVENKVEAITGMPMHYHAMVDFSGFQQAVDAVGGIDINVTLPVFENMRIDGRPYTLNVKAGQQHFDGFRALAYSRSRMTSSRGDFDRAERQKSVIVGLKDKALSLGTLSNPVKVTELINALGGHISSNLSINELMRLYDIVKGVTSEKVQSVSLVDTGNVLIKGANIGGAVQVPKAGNENYKEIQNYLRNKLRDGFLRKEDASIAVYNGTSTTGLAARTATDLRSYGYNITTVSDSPVKGNQETILVNLRGDQKKYTKHYLEQRLSVKAVDKLPSGIAIDPGAADFVIILGTNEVTRLAE